MTFDNQDEAAKVRKALAEGQREGYVQLDDAAIIAKDTEENLIVRHETDTGVKVGAGVGGLLGLLIGFMFAGPLASLIVGAMGGAAVGSMLELGVDKSFVKEVVESMKPGTSALFIIVRDADPNPALAALKPYKGTVLHTTLPTETEENLRRILETRK